MYEWILSDPDCCQHIRQLNTEKTLFEVYQIQSMGREERFKVIHAFVDLNDYDIHSSEFYHEYIVPYGYDSLSDVFKIYGDFGEQILAEIIVEMEALDWSPVCNGTYQKCQSYIEKAIALHALANGNKLM